MPRFLPSPFAFAAALAGLIVMLSPLISRAEDGSRLWLRYRPAVDSPVALDEVIVPGESPTLDVLRAEIKIALEGLTGRPPKFTDTATRDGGLVVVTPASLARIESPGWADELKALGR